MPNRRFIVVVSDTVGDDCNSRLRVTDLARRIGSTNGLSIDSVRAEDRFDLRGNADRESANKGEVRGHRS